MNKHDLIIVRGAGDISTGTIHRLTRAGFSVLALETERPAAIRRKVSFSEAVFDGKAEVEGVTAVRLSGNGSFSVEDTWREAEQILAEGQVPVLIDPSGKSIRAWQPFAVIDAILAKKNLGTSMDMAGLTIGLGPGFTAGKDVHYVIETMRGHDLGRILETESALPNTGVPGVIAGYGAERVIHTAAAGIFEAEAEIGDMVRKGERIACIRTEEQEVPVYASLTGILRGILRSGFQVPAGFKAADIDPRPEEQKNCYTISDKARCIAGSVLEIICRAKTENQTKSKL